MSSAQRYLENGTWRERTFTQLHADVDRVATKLRAYANPGDKVALLAPTSPEWTICDLAIARIGAICVPIYPTSAPRQISWILEDSGAVAAFADKPGRITTIPVLGTEIPDTPADPGPLPGTRPDDVATIVSTSGTTGDPKGCVLTHRNITSIVATLRQLTDAGPGDVLFAYLPLAHLLTRMLQYFCLETGATIAYSSGDIRTVLTEPAEVAPTYLPSVPAMFEKIHAAVRALAADETLRTRIRQAFGGRLKQALTGSAPIAPEILEFFFAAGIPIYEPYGMTESTAVLTANTPEACRVGTVGRAVPGVELEIAEDGEVLARSEGVFAGYHNNKAATEETIVDGWLHTGDLGSLDADGFLTLTGRKKDLVITSAGKNLSPAAIENDLRRTRWIAGAVLLGDRRPYPVALLSVDPDDLPALAGETGINTVVPGWHTDERLRSVIARDVESVNARYSPPERIRDFALVPEPFSVESGELTPTLKIRRDVVARRHAALVDALYPAP